jgi:Fe2+ or Zn2+ uptake regulation protein
MIEKNIDHDYSLLCDECGTEVDDVFDSFEEAVAFKKDKTNGWHSVKTDDEWEDLCPNCWDRIHAFKK